MKYNKVECAYILKRAKKLKAIDFLGGKCQSCGCTDFWKIEFHHKKDKKERISKLIESRWSLLENELYKCVLLCSCCHKEHHSKDIPTEGSMRHYKNKEILLDYYGKNSCERCGYAKCIGALEFHHNHSKHDNIHSMIKSKRLKTVSDIPDNVLREIAKCSLLCSNCHLSEHFDFDKFEKYKDAILKKKCYVYECPPKIDKEQVLLLLKRGLKQYEIVKELGVSKCSVSTITKSLRESGRI